MRELEPGLLDLASAQGGAFSAAQAARLGVDAVALSRLAASGGARRVRRGAYVVDRLLTERPEERYAAEVRAVVLSRGPRTHASHHAALAVAGLPLVDCDLRRIDVCSPVARTFTRSGLTTHPLPAGEPTVEVRGVRTVSLASAITQVARRCVRAAVVAGDAALRGDLVVMSDLRRRAAVERFVELLDARAESPGESITRLLLTSLGWSVESQVSLHDSEGFIGRVDFLVARRVVVEFDGLVKYEGAQGRQALALEKRREDRLRAAGNQVVRLTWRDLNDARRVSSMVGDAAHRAGLGSAPT